MTEEKVTKSTALMGELVAKGHENGLPAISKGMVEVAMTRAAQEVQAAMVIAKRFPRDETAAYTRIIQACRRRTLAEGAMYAYPRGNTTVTGASIRLAEVMARAWGNLDFGIIEMEQRHGASVMMSYAWDLETNTRATKIFTVPHIRETKQGNYDITGARDIYEVTANIGARRLRACILAMIPGDFQEAAVEECERTLAAQSSEPLIDRVRKMVSAFLEMGVTQPMIEQRLGHKVETIIEQEMVVLRKIYAALKDNMADRSAYFDLPETATPTLQDTFGKHKAFGFKTTAVKPASPKTPHPTPEDADADADADFPFGANAKA